MQAKQSFLKQNKKLVLLLMLMTLLFVVIGIMYAKSRKEFNSSAINTAPVVNNEPKNLNFEPVLKTEELIGGLSHPWDTVFLPDGTMLFSERNGTISKIENKNKVVVQKISDVYSDGEGGLTGLTIDNNFTENRFLYTCMNARTAVGIDVRVSRWKLNKENSALEDRQDIVTGIPSNRSGRHSGCRVRAAADGTLWVGTGDAAIASNPQNPKNLGGKILHVTRDGMPSGSGLPSPFDPRIFSYGHRNVQGLVIFEKPRGDIFGYSVEHGSDRDDEINLLKKGNFGWAPRITYIEAGIPMTDLSRFPDAVSAIWSSGSPTIAPSGAVKIKSEKWGKWNNAVAMAVLKAKHVRLMKFDQQDKLLEEKVILTEFGRVRSVNQDSDGNLYITTDNGSNDKIIKVVPSKN